MQFKSLSLSLLSIPRNNTHSYKIAVPLIVLQKDPGSCVSSHVQPDSIMIPLEGDGELSCPDIEGALTKLSCQVFFTFVMNSETEVWWTIDGKREETFTDPRVEIDTSVECRELEDKIITKTLQIKEFSLQDVKRNYTCFARNVLGEVSRQANLRLTTPAPIVELACGLGVTLLLMISLSIVCYVYWLELVLLYRAHFGTDESVTDGKDYDIYISYARHAEEEEFVLLTLRSVLENEFGYKMCIFDRDSLPGGTITDETLGFIRRSRRLIVVLSPNYLLKGSQTLLELKAGVNNMAQSGSVRVILVQFKPLKAAGQLKELKRARAALTVIKWKGEKSNDLRCRFWKQLRVALPVKRKLTPETTPR
ncbi:UNVERIFIED_CONTAM: hypothetical protein FKN15_063814 [Acipenser sinensis]